MICTSLEACCALYWFYFFSKVWQTEAVTQRNSQLSVCGLYEPNSWELHSQPQATGTVMGNCTVYFLIVDNMLDQTFTVQCKFNLLLVRQKLRLEMCLFSWEACPISCGLVKCLDEEGSEGRAKIYVTWQSRVEHIINPEGIVLLMLSCHCCQIIKWHEWQVFVSVSNRVE